MVLSTIVKIGRNLEETKLAEKVINWLADQHWDVYQEVQFGLSTNVADIVAVRHGILWVIECKTTFGFRVLEQAAMWDAHYRSIAIPWARSRTNRSYRVATDYYQVGVIEVDHDFVSEIEDAPLIRKNQVHAKRLIEYLTELHKTYAKAGSTGRQHLTPYKETILEVKKVIEKNPGCSVQFLYDQLGKMHYSSRASFKGNLIKSLNDFEKDWCHIDMNEKPYRLFIKNDENRRDSGII